MKPAHILLVEDNEGDIALTLDSFEDSKITAEITIVRNGQEALDFLFKKGLYKDSKKPDLILLDINIPIFNGHEVLEQIKEAPSLQKIPVIMLTTSLSPNDVSLAYEKKCYNYMEKPLDVDEFLKTVLKIDEFGLQLSKLT